MTRNTLVSIIAATLLTLPLTAWAQPKVTVTLKAEKETVSIENGKKVSKRVEAKDVFPGDEVLYTLSYANTGTEAATNVVVSDPIPAGTAYITGSASEVGDLVFSIDKGKSYKKPALLSYEVTTGDGKKVKRVASPEEYTHIRWTIPSVAPGGKGSVSFKVKVK